VTEPPRSRRPTQREPRKTATLSRNPVIGRVLGGCEIMGVLGKGGMATVYRGRQARLKRDVAVKILDPKRCRDPEEVRQFVLEAQTMSKFNHPNVIGVFGVGEEDETHFLLLELVEAGSLYDLLKEAGRLTPEETITFACQMASGLAMAHERGVVHRDIKPHNVLVAEGRQMKITDFGLAIMDEDGSGGALGSKNKVVGTPHYMSPEQVDAIEVDRRTDVYALGASMYHMVTGKPMFQAKSVVELLLKQISDEPEPPHTRCSEVPTWLSEVILKAVAKDRRVRYQRCEDLIRDLERRGVTPDKVKAPPPPPPPAALMEHTAPLRLVPQPVRAPRSPLVTFGTAALLLTAAVLGALLQGELKLVLFEPQVTQQELIEEQASHSLLSLERRLEADALDLATKARQLGDFASTYAGSGAALEAKAKASESLAAHQAEEKSAVSKALKSAQAEREARRLGPALDALGKLKPGLSAEAMQPATKLRAEIEAELQSLGVSWVSGGSFLSGEDKRRRERFLDGFYVQTREVSCRDYAIFVAAKKHAAPAGWGGPTPPEASLDLPVTGVSAKDAVAYAKWWGGRVPKTYEWEKAARGTQGHAWPWGADALDPSRCVWGVGAKLAKVGTHPKDRSPFG
jgi:serine/threonine protein kinase